MYFLVLLLQPVYKKLANTGLLLHFDSPVDQRYKKGLLKKLLNIEPID